MTFALLGLAVSTMALAAYIWRQRARQLTLAREHKIRTYVFSSAALHGVTKTYPHLEHKDAQLVARALRQFFLVHGRTANALIAMPSKAVDALWHEFILDTRAYRDFCEAAFGSFFHHVPASAMGSDHTSDAAMRRTWRFACLEENIDPAKATRLPLLFAIDAKLSIPGAVTVTPDTFKRRRGGSGGSDGGCGGGGTEHADGGCGGGCGGD